jgi:hypothetical protein
METAADDKHFLAGWTRERRVLTFPVFVVGEVARV